MGFFSPLSSLLVDGAGGLRVSTPIGMLGFASGFRGILPGSSDTGIGVCAASSMGGACVGSVVGTCVGSVIVGGVSSVVEAARTRFSAMVFTWSWQRKRCCRTERTVSSSSVEASSP